jgi:hypothetical protein
MSSFRFVVVQGSLTGAGVFLCLAAAAQWVAAVLAYQPALGAPVIDLFGAKLYAPWKPFTWWLAFDSQAPDVFAGAGVRAALDGVLSGALAIGGAARRADRPRVPTTYGSARWVDFHDVPILWRPAIPARCAQLSGASMRAEFVGHCWPPTNLLSVPLTSCSFPPFPIVSPPPAVMMLCASPLLSFHRLSASPLKSLPTMRPTRSTKWCCIARLADLAETNGVDK